MKWYCNVMVAGIMREFVTSAQSLRLSLGGHHHLVCQNVDACLSSEKHLERANFLQMLR